MGHDLLEPVRVPSKRAAVQAALRKLAKRLGAGTKMPTVNELCASLEVSRATLDHALAELERGGVLKRHHGSGIYVAPGLDEATLAVLIGNDPLRQSMSPSYRLQIEAIERVLADRDGRVDVYVDAAAARSPSVARRHLANDIRAGMVQGVVLLGSSGPEQFDWLTRQGVPFVGLGGGRRGWRVTTDKARLIDQALRALVERGCQRIGMVRHMEGRLLRERGDAGGERFKRALAEHGLRFEPAYSRQWVREVDEWRRPLAATFEELGYQAGCDLASVAPADRPDGLVVLDDMMARGLMVGLTRSGVELGRDVAIASFAMRDSSALLGFEDRIDRIEFEADDLARATCAMLQTLIDGQRPRTNRTYIPPARLIPRSR